MLMFVTVKALTFSQVLLLEAPIAVTLAEQALEEFNQVAVNKLGQYVCKSVTMFIYVYYFL